MKKYIFKSQDNSETKIVKGYCYHMLPSGNYQVDRSCFDKEIISCIHWYLAKVEELY